MWLRQLKSHWDNIAVVKEYTTILPGIISKFPKCTVDIENDSLRYSTWSATWTPPLWWGPFFLLKFCAILVVGFCHFGCRVLPFCLSPDIKQPFINVAPHHEGLFLFADFVEGFAEFVTENGDYETTG